MTRFSRLSGAALVMAAAGGIAYVSVAVCPLSAMDPQRSRLGAAYCAFVNSVLSSCTASPSN